MFQNKKHNVISKFSVLFSVYLVNIISAKEQYGKLVTEGKLCKDLAVDDSGSEYFNIGKDVLTPIVYHYPKGNGNETSDVPYPHTLRIVIPLGDVVTLDAFAAMAVDETGLPTGRFHSCTPLSSDTPQTYPYVVSHKCTIGQKNWENTYMGYQFPLRIISAGNYSKAVEFLWSWVKGRHAPMLIQFRFIGIENAKENSGAKFYGVLVSPVVETTELFKKTSPIKAQELKKLQCFEYVPLKAEIDDTKPASSDYFTFADGFAPQVEIPLKSEYLELVENKDSKVVSTTAETAEAISTKVTTLSTSTTKTTTSKTTITTPKSKKKHWVVVNNKIVPQEEAEESVEDKNADDDTKTDSITDDSKRKETKTEMTTKKVLTTTTITTTTRPKSTTTAPVTTVSPSPVTAAIERAKGHGKSRNSPDAFDQLEVSQRIHRQAKATKSSMIAETTTIKHDTGNTTTQPITTSTHTDEGTVEPVPVTEIVPTIIYHKAKKEEIKTFWSFLHSITMLFVWIVCVPNSTFIARYFKESYFNEYVCNIPSWFMLHVVMSVAACLLMAISSAIAFYDFNSDPSWPENQELRVHILLGIGCLSLFAILMVIGWFKCEEDSAPQFLNRSVHFVLGNNAYIFALILIWRAHYLGMPCATWIICLFWIIWSAAANMAMSNHFYWQDKTMELKHNHRAFIPLPIEKIVTGEPPGTEMKERIFIWHFGGSFLAFSLITMLHLIKDDRCFNCQFEFLLGCKLPIREY